MLALQGVVLAACLATMTLSRKQNKSQQVDEKLTAEESRKIFLSFNTEHCLVSTVENGKCV